MGTQARVTPEGLMTSTRVVTSKVRQAVAGAAIERIGRASALITMPADAPALVFTNVRLSMNPPFAHLGCEIQHPMLRAVAKESNRQFRYKGRTTSDRSISP